MKRSEQEKQEAVERLKEWIQPGDTLYTILRHVSKSGMMRRISVKKVVCDPKDGPDVLHLDYNVARACGLSNDGDNGIKMSGCGMDMGFALVYELSSALFGSGYQCLGAGKCPSAYHTNHRREVHCNADDCAGPRTFGRYADADAPVGCAACNHTGYVPNPDGPERFDLIHKDGYALRQRWM